MSIVREFLAGSLTAAGAVVEESGSGLDVLLPADEATRLAVPEDLRIATDTAPAEGDGRTDGRLGSLLLDRLIDQCSAVPPLALVALPQELPRPLPESFPVLLNAVRSGQVVRERRAARYIELVVRITSQGDELRSARASVWVRLTDGARVSPLPLGDAYPVAGRPLDGPEVGLVRSAMARWVRRDGRALLAGPLESVQRRARRDLERMAEYYASLDEEMARAARRARSADERARREAKRARLADDLAARRVQIQERFKTRVSARLIAATLVQTDADRFTVGVRRRRRGGDIVVTGRPGGSGFEGPGCAACRAVTSKLYLCDDRLHVLCSGCGQQGRLGAERCPACKPPAGDAAPRTPLSVEDPTAALRLGT